MYVYIFCYLFFALDALIFFDGNDSKVGSLLKQTPNIMRHNLRHIFIRESKIVKAQSQQYSLAFWSGTLYKMEHTRLDDLLYNNKHWHLPFFIWGSKPSFFFSWSKKTTQVQLVSPYYIISDHCVRERALVASYFGQVIGQYFFFGTLLPPPHSRPDPPKM